MPSDYYYDDLIERLDLETRVIKALRRGKILTIGSLMDAYRERRLKSVKGIGEEYFAKLVVLLEDLVVFEGGRVLPETLARLGLMELVKREGAELRELYDSGLLDLRVCFQDRNLREFLNWNDDSQMHWSEAQEFLQKFRARSLSDELVQVFEVFGVAELELLLGRHGVEVKEWPKLSQKFGISRHNLALREKRLQKRLHELFSRSSAGAFLQTALLLAKDMGSDFSFGLWMDKLRQDGFLPERDILEDVDILSILLMLYRVLGRSLPQFKWPVRFDLLLPYAFVDMYLPLRILELLKAFGKEARRDLFGSLEAVGVLSLDWAVGQFKLSAENMRLVLRGLGYSELVTSWYVLPSYDVQIRLIDVFHRSLLKLMQYVGPLSLDAIEDCLATIACKYPLPPRDVLIEVLQFYGYWSENSRWTYTGELKVGLMRAERILLDCFANKQIVEHFVLGNAMLAGGMSFASLHPTLNTSVLFKQVQYGHYALRGHED